MGWTIGFRFLIRAGIFFITTSRPHNG